ncbi:response regulator [Marinimicrobium sp. ABcell2]|uniref:response regulator n=1 Tax=Marinimicrobium sp. ABcell2 TaxID=3069751 RepID=UPI0027B4602B|nr:response regulator [Marinimicrobium sp. ABcell2]MDQ2076837.1 response regulator [Marinimicrobium sp. ABcell2]
MTKRVRPIEILLVEDNPADVDLILESFEESTTPSRLHTVSNGELALQFLNREGDYAEAVQPDIILLDLNLPRMDGRDVLAVVKSDPQLMHIPVLVLTSSEAEKDVRDCYQLHANCYIIKPAGLKHFYQVARTIEDFWFGVAVLPVPP